MASVLTQLAQGLTDPENQVLCRSIFGTADPQVIQQVIQQVCQRYCGHAIALCKFWEVSVSFTIGLQLVNGERVVLKFRSPENITMAMLQAVCQVQQQLAERGFPCPKVLLMPVQQGSCFVTIEQLLDTGENGNAHHPVIRQAMAAGLARQIQLAESLGELPHLPRSRFHPAQLWEKPHNALFDFEKTQQGAEWIDQIAAAAQHRLSSYEAPLIVGHMDWSVKNMRFQQDQLSAVYDWDSLRLENELVVVGNAAKGFLVTWYVDVGDFVPTPAAVRQFIQAYETARGRSFSSGERQIIQAAFLYSMAYTARCEHALDPAGKNYVGSFRASLQNAAY